MRIIVGLGNPGEKYKNTRHNIGFMVVDALAKQQDLIWQTNKKFNAEIIVTKDIPDPAGYQLSSMARQEEERAGLILVKPQTFMNNSGQAAQRILTYYKLLPKKFNLIQKKDSNLSAVLTVIHDDIDIESGKSKISVNSRSAGHRGVQSIINHLKTKNFKRIRIGIRTEAADKIPAEKFVLQKFSEEEMNIVNSSILKIINTIQNIA